jgi:hypothetical protein
MSVEPCSLGESAFSRTALGGMQQGTVRKHAMFPRILRSNLRPEIFDLMRKQCFYLIEKDTLGARHRKDHRRPSSVVIHSEVSRFPLTGINNKHMRGGTHRDDPFLGT